MKSKQPQRSFPFLQVNRCEGKPRKRELTEIRGPYYSVVARRYLQDVFETMGAYIDSLKFAGGSFTLMPSVGTEVKREPVACELGHSFQRARFFKEVRRAGNDFQFYLAAHPIARHLVQLHYNIVVAADDEQRGRLDVWQRVTG